jgi:hypothetical protein
MTPTRAKPEKPPTQLAEFVEVHQTLNQTFFSSLMDTHPYFTLRRRFLAALRLDGET